MQNNCKMVAKTFFGFEEILAKELRQLGAGNVRPGVRHVSFEGDTGFMYKANLCLRTALKVIQTVAGFRVKNERDLYSHIYEMDWQAFLRPGQTFSIDTTMHSEIFSNSYYLSQKVKDAIVDKMRDKTGNRPNVDTKYPDLRINIHIQENWCNVGLDTSGASLHQRGYRTGTNIAPINEVLAAGMLLLSGWDGLTDFVDPMCGSGTIPIEAAMIACNIPANINRKGFAFMKWDNFEEDLFHTIVNSSLGKAREFEHTIVGYDKAPSAVRKAIDNVENAGLEEYVRIEQQNFFGSEREGERKLHLLFNPPYGERLPIEVSTFYGQIGSTLKHGYPNSDAWFITSNMEGLKHVGLRPSRKIKLFNGKLESRLVKFEMYAGSKKAKKQRQNEA